MNGVRFPPAVLSIKRSLSNVLSAEVIEGQIQTFSVLYLTISKVRESTYIHLDFPLFKFESCILTPSWVWFGFGLFLYCSFLPCEELLGLTRLFCVVWSEMTVRAPLLKKGAVIHFGKVPVCGNERSFAGASVFKRWLHPATSCRERQRWGKIRCRLAQCAFAPTVTFTAASSHWEDRLIRSCADPRLLSVCHFSLSLLICSTFYCIVYVFKLLIFSITIFCLTGLHILLSSI